MESVHRLIVVCALLAVSCSGSAFDMPTSEQGSGSTRGSSPTTTHARRLTSTTRPFEDASSTLATGSDVATSGALPACDEDAAERTVDDFISAIAGGELTGDEIVSMFIALPGAFKWFGTPQRPYPGSGSDRESLAGYLQEVIDSGDAWSLISFTHTGFGSVQGVGNFVIDVRGRFGSDGARVLSTKGAVDCDTGKIAVWLTQEPPR